MLQRNVKIHRHKVDIEKRIMNISKRIQNNASAPSTAITTNRKQLIYNNDISHPYYPGKDKHKTSYDPTLTTLQQNEENIIPQGRRTFSYAQQSYNRPAYCVKQRKYRQDYVEEPQRQLQNKQGYLKSQKNEKSNKYLSQYMGIIQAEDRPYGKISSTRRNGSQKFSSIGQNKNNSNSVVFCVQNTNNLQKNVRKQQPNQNNVNLSQYYPYKQRQLIQKINIQKDNQIEQILQQVMLNQKKLQNEVYQLKSQLEKQNQRKQFDKNNQKNSKSVSNHNSISINSKNDCIYSFSGQSFDNNSNLDQNKNLKYSQYQIPSQSILKNNKQKVQISHDPYMKTIGDNPITSTGGIENQYNYDRVLKMIKQKQKSLLMNRNRQQKSKQNQIRIEDDQQANQQHQSKQKKTKEKTHSQIKNNFYKQKLHMIVKTGTPITERYIVSQEQKQIFYEQLKKRIIQAQFEYTDIMHRNNRFQHERLIGANQLQKKIRDNALAIVYQQCNKSIYK